MFTNIFCSLHFQFLVWAEHIPCNPRRSSESVLIDSTFATLIFEHHHSNVATWPFNQLKHMILWTDYDSDSLQISEVHDNLEHVIEEDLSEF